MAQFYAHIRGARGPTSRLGTKVSGITSSTKSWDGEVNVHAWHDASTDPNAPRDMIRVTFGGHNHGPSLTLYHGPADGWRAYLQAGELGRMAWFAEHTSLHRKPVAAVTTSVTTE